jgi:hypothetical protein
MKRFLRILVLLSTLLAGSILGAAPASAASYGKYCPVGGYPNVPYCVLDIPYYWGGPTVSIYVDTSWGYETRRWDLIGPYGETICYGTFTPNDPGRYWTCYGVPTNVQLRVYVPKANWQTANIALRG